ncbi:MAG: hypothetical protein AAFX93_06745 [Verrucomicrobiota bacterium]
MKENRIISAIEKGSRVLIAGAGGGFDIFSGLPLYFYLRQKGIFAFLANLTFTPLQGAKGKALTNTSLIVDADAGGSMGYFPENICRNGFARMEWTSMSVVSKGPARKHSKPITRPFASSWRSIRSSWLTEA